MRKGYKIIVALTVLSTLALAACRPVTKTPPSGSAAASATIAATAAPTSAATEVTTPEAAATEATTPAATSAAGATYTDPFAYCAAVGTIDAPDAGYTGPAVPESVVNALRVATKASPDSPNDVWMNGTYWRCADGNVYACFVGANIPCWAKANTDKTPSQAMLDACTETPDADFLPAAVTGHETVYEWRCTDGKPEIVRQVLEVDAQGYQTDFWYKLTPP